MQASNLFQIQNTFSSRETQSEIFSQQFCGHSVRVYGTTDDPLFVAADVCRVLGIGNPTEALRSLDDDERITLSNPEGNPRAGIPHQFTVITESGLYHLITKSRKPEAKAFRKWVTAEVLPAIRKTGYYSAAPKLPGTYLEALKALTREVEHTERLTLQNATLAREVEQMQPKVEFFDRAMDAHTTLLVSEAAKLLSNAVPGGIGGHRLFKWLRKNGWLMHDNIPYQDRVDAGLMVIKERPIRTNGGGGTLICLTPMVTQKGLALLFRRIAGLNKAEANKAVYGEEVAS